MDFFPGKIFLLVEKFFNRALIWRLFAPQNYKTHGDKLRSIGLTVSMFFGLPFAGFTKSASKGPKNSITNPFELIFSL